MPFDPKLIHPEEPPLTPRGELDLPADLAALGEQLGADAAHLSRCYPAAQKQTARAAPYTKYAFAALGSALAALLVAALIWQSLPGRPAAERATLPLTADALPAASPAIATPHHPDAVSLADLSGPELEALLDLLARDPNRATTISF